MKKNSVFISLFFLLTLLSSQTIAQVFSDKVVGKKNVEKSDSIKKSAYPYSLPIWGEKVTKAGYKLPYSAGMSAQYLWQESDLIIENLKVGFNNGPMYDLDGIVRFNEAKATAQGITIRPDVWVLPFLNVYAILGRTNASTQVGFGVYVPDSSNTEKELFSASSTVDFKATTIGFGMTPTIGVGGGFLALDMNCAWTDVPQLSKPAFSFIFGPRLGKSFNLKKPESAISIWAGGFRLKLNSETYGSVNLSDVIPSDGSFATNIDNAQQKVGDAQQKVDSWWNSLSQTEQNNPVNKAKYNTANNVLERAGGFLNSAEQAANNIQNSSVQYSMDKRPKDMWNFIVGSQYQFNKHWMYRLEVGFLSSRVQVTTGLQFRFGL